MLDTHTRVPVTPLSLDVSELSEAEQAHLRSAAVSAARSAAWLPGKGRSARPRAILNDTLLLFKKVESRLRRTISDDSPEELRTLHDNLRLIHTSIADLQDSVKFLAKLPQVRTTGEDAIPRVIPLARTLVASTGERLTVAKFVCFVEAVQGVEPLRLGELWGMLPALRLVMFERITAEGKAALDGEPESATAPRNIDKLGLGLRLISDLDWKRTIEALSFVHRILLHDPEGVYGRMDYDSREMYRQAVEKIAARSDVSEIDLAKRLVYAAQQSPVAPSTSPSLARRLRHVGYYLIDENGGREFLKTIAYRPSLAKAIELLFHRFPDEVYIIGIEVLTLITVVGLIMSLVQNHSPLGLFWGALLLIIPATQAAVELMNYFATAVLTPRPLAKLDFREAVDADSATMVAIPTLLINDKQIHQLVDDLEVRYLVNRDRNICYALLTDLPDSSEPAGEHDPRIDLALRLIEGLNEKYAGDDAGGFYLFHRHRVYNPREGTWMGWERKRGKLLDLNQMLRKAYDPFPVKAGDLSRLGHIRYVLTLDSDTQLPRGSAQKLIGAIAHPLNSALIDPELNIVTMGYGILQPRVGISVHSATRSRLASIYSGQTGFDIYSRAVSDIYQDLYGEGIFTGKGIYDVDALRQVLEQRFPRNALLSHDLIEGAYARAGLVSDIEVIDDYPSHYSAYNRRKHRWLRGDWQIARWVFGKVPDESGKLVRNPISLVSKWKIVDNLRRSLVEPATFALLIAGWFWLPGGPRFWTFTTLALLFVPIYFRLIFSLTKACFTKRWMEARESSLDFLTSHVSIFLNIAFLAHQALVALDAIIRTIIRSTITHSRLLEWETATEAELGIRKRTPVDVYLEWVPALAVVFGLLLFLRPAAAPYALPFIVSWFLSKLISNWLNRSPHPEDFDLKKEEIRFLRDVALRTWLYFKDFSNEKNGWLIPDNVQLEPYRIADRLSPTNYGLLLNSRQAAHEFGYITLSEFVDLTEKSLHSVLGLQRFKGHFLNWYDNLSREPLEPRFASTVDSGNLVASLWSLKQGCLEWLRDPVFKEQTRSGLEDHLTRDAAGSAWRKRLRGAGEVDTWLPDILTLDATGALAERQQALAFEAEAFAPWLLPRFSSVRAALRGDAWLRTAPLIPSKANEAYSQIESQLKSFSGPEEAQAQVSELLVLLPECRRKLQDLAARLSSLASLADRTAAEMDFGIMVDHDRRLLSIGWDVSKNELNKSCYDLLASESRTATFIAVAKGETVQDSWFRLGRTHTLCEGESVLISWTGTMFEYLMPMIWERSHPNTLLDRATQSAVRSHQAYGNRQRVPWGISEAAFSKRDADGNYQYHAFGLPGLALSVARENTLVISPYSSCLALMVDPVTAVDNLVRMSRNQWLGDYGFFESADYSESSPRLWGPRRYELVKCWMAHHQGMSLAAICNILRGSPFQRWFHAEPLVQASDLILQERPLRVRPLADNQPKTIFSFAKNSLKGASAKLRASA